MGVQLLGVFLPFRLCIDFSPMFAYSLYGIICLLAALFVWKSVPETKGKTLEDMTASGDPPEKESMNLTAASAATVHPVIRKLLRPTTAKRCQPEEFPISVSARAVLVQEFLNFATTRSYVGASIPCFRQASNSRTTALVFQTPVLSSSLSAKKKSSVGIRHL